MSKFLAGVALFGVLPVIYGAFANFGEVYEYATTKSIKGLQMWKVGKNQKIKTLFLKSVFVT